MGIFNPKGKVFLFDPFTHFEFKISQKSGFQNTPLTYITPVIQGAKG